MKELKIFGKEKRKMDTMQEVFGSDVELSEGGSENLMENRRIDSGSNGVKSFDNGSKPPKRGRAPGALDIRRNAKALKTLKTLQNMAHIAGFNIVENITLQDTETGVQWALNGK